MSPIANNKRWFPKQDALDTTAALLKTLICHIGIPVSMASIEKQVTCHKEYPNHSLKALQDILFEWGVKTMLVVTRINELQPFSILPICPSTENKHPEYTLFYRIDDDAVEYMFPEKGWITEEVEDFEGKWVKEALVITGIEGYCESGE